MKKKILLTGSEGFIGSHLLEKLISLNYDVKAVVLYNSFNTHGWLDYLPKKIQNKINIFTGDIRDQGFVSDLVKHSDIVINLAALIGIPYSYKTPHSYVDTNVVGLLNLLTASKANKIDRFIQISTSEVYGISKEYPITEDQPVVANSPYAASKIAAEQLCLSFFKSYNFPSVVLRPFNAYGPRQSGRAIIPTIISQITSGKKTIKLGNINTTRDFNYVGDIVNGIVKSISAKKIEGEIINIGSGYEVSIKELVNEISNKLNKKIKIKIENKRKRPDKSEVKRLLASNKKAKRLLKWSPEYFNRQGLRRGLEKTLIWYSEEKNKKFIKENIYNI
jgi:NAD dependent epimerase/dehydratase